MFSLLTGASLRPGVQSIHPATKVAWLCAACVAAFRSDQPQCLLVVLVMLWATSVAARLDLRALWKTVRLSLPFCVALFVLQLVLRHEGPVAWRLSPLTVHQAALFIGFLDILRIQCLATAGAQFWQWTHPTDLALMLLAWGVPYRYAFLPTVAFRAFPLLGHELARVVEGQQLRGIELQRGWAQVLYFPRLFIPFCIRTLGVGNDMALAMELRGYGSQPKRTHLRSITFRWWDGALVGVLLIALCYLCAFN